MNTICVYAFFVHRKTNTLLEEIKKRVLEVSGILDDPQLSPQEIFKQKWLLFAKNAMKQVLYLGAYSLLVYFILTVPNIKSIYHNSTWGILYAFLAYYISIVTLRNLLKKEDENILDKFRKHTVYASFPCCFLPAAFVYYYLVMGQPGMVLFTIDWYFQLEIMPIFVACSLTIFLIGLNNIWLYARFVSEKSVLEHYSK